MANLNDNKNASPLDIVKDVYSLLRLFSLTFNFVTLGKDENKACLPAAFSGELKKILTEANYKKIEETF